MAVSSTGRPKDSSGPSRHTAWWLLARHRDGQTEVLTLASGGHEVLPVFGFREEAEMYSLIETLGGDWQVRETDARELVSVLYGSCARVSGVAIDLIPTALADGDGELASIDRERFVSRVVRKEA